MPNRRYILIPLMLLTLFVAYQASITMFAHIHYINGVMIVHSHPSADDQHSHTETQIVTMAQVSNFLGMEPTFVTIEEISLSLFKTLEYKRECRFLFDAYLSDVSLRAPPVCC